MSSHLETKFAAIQDGSTTSSISLRDVRRLLKRKRRQMSITFTSILALSILGTLLWPTRYKTELKLLVKNNRPDMIVASSETPNIQLRDDVDETQVNSEIELLTSKSLLEEVVRQCGLDRLESEPDHNLAVEAAAKHLDSALSISGVKKSNIILIEYLDGDADRAVKVLDTVGQVYLEHHVTAHSNPGGYAAFKAVQEESRRTLEESEARLAGFEAKNQVDLLDRQKEAALQRVTDLESALLTAEADIETREGAIRDSREQLKQVPLRITTAKKQSTNEFSVDHTTAMLADAQNRRTQLLTKYLPDDRLVLEADEEIQGLKKTLEEARKMAEVEEQTDVNPVRQALLLDLSRQEEELEALVSKKHLLIQQLADHRSQQLKLSTLTFDLDDLIRAKKEAENNYLLYAKKAEEVRIADTLNRQKIANVSIAAAPVRPYKPFWPKKILNIAVGVLLGAIVSVVWVLLSESLAGTINDVFELETLSGVPVLAAFPDRLLAEILPELR